MTEFYGEKVEPGVTDPGLDPLLTVRIKGPEEQKRRLDINTPRAVRVCPGSPRPWVTANYGLLWLSDLDVAGWAVEDRVTIGAAQRLAAGRESAPAGPVPELVGDDEELPFKDKGGRS